MVRGAWRAFEHHLPEFQAIYISRKGHDPIRWKVSFTQDETQTESADDPEPASKYSGKMSPEEKAEEQGAQDAGNPGSNPKPPEDQPEEAQAKKNSTEASPLLPEKSTKKQRWEHFEDEIRRLMNKDRHAIEGRCEPARPVPMKELEGSSPSFLRPKLPLCSRQTKVCNLVVDPKEGKLITKAEMEAKKSEEEEIAQRAAASGNPPPEGIPPPPPPPEEEQGLGGNLSWPGNSMSVALVRPMPVHSCDAEHPAEKKLSGYSGARRDRVVRRHADGHSFL